MSPTIQAVSYVAVFINGLVTGMAVAYAIVTL
jgi:hypothetical protein